MYTKMKRKQVAKKQVSEIKKAVGEKSLGLLSELEAADMRTKAYFEGLRSSGSEGEADMLRGVKGANPKTAVPLPKGIKQIVEKAAGAREEYTLPDAVKAQVKRMKAQKKSGK